MNLTNALPHFERELLEHPPLALVVAQISFPTILLSIPTDDTLLARFQDEVRDLYPILLIGHQMGFSLGMGGIQQQPTTTRSFQFTDSERQWTVALAANAVSLEARSYTNINEFTDRFSKIIATAKEIYRIDQRARLGLRYVNEIRYPGADNPADWRSLIRKELLGPLADENIASRSITTFQELSLRISDGGLTLRHGFFPQGTTIAPAPGTTNAPEAQGAFYLLDLDASDDTGGEMDIQAIEKLLRSYNETVFSLFRWGLSEELFKHLKGSV